MKQKLNVFDPPMCCATGVCGVEVDNKLVQFAADLEWLKANGVAVRRFNLTHEPQAFMNEPEVLKSVSSDGTQCLPLIVADGKIVSQRMYPTRNELAVLAGLTPVNPLAVVADSTVRAGNVQNASSPGGCCGEPAGNVSAACCSGQVKVSS